MDSLGSTMEAPGRRERTIWTAWEAPGRHQGGRKGLVGQPGGTREAPGTGKDHLDSLGGTREAPGRQESTNWTACEAPGRQERTIDWDSLAWEAPGRHQGGRKGLWTAWEAPGRHQGGRKGQSAVRHQGGRKGWTAWEASREAPGRQERTNWTACEAPWRPGRQESLDRIGTAIAVLRQS